MNVPRRAEPALRKLVQRLLLGAAGVAVMTGAAGQSRWQHSLVVPAEIEYDSNPGMTPGGSAGTTWLKVRPTVATKYVHGNEEFSAEAALSAEKSSNTEVAQDRLDPSLRGVWKHVDELNTTELGVLLERRAFRDLDVRRQVPVGVDGTATLMALTASWLRDLDARTSFTADLRHDWESFNAGTTADFQRTAAAARITRAQDERRNWYAVLNAQAYSPEDAVPTAAAPVPPERATAVGALLGLEHAFSEALSVDVSAGPVHFARPDARTSWQGGVRAEYTALRWQLVLDAVRVPAVNTTLGGLAITEEMRVRGRYDLDPLSRLEAEGSYARERAARTNRTLASIAWVRQWTPEWQFSIKGSLHRQEGPEGAARSNRIGVMLVYSALDL